MLEKSTDFRLLDRRVIDEFNLMTEHERLARGLFDWLGFPYAVVPFRAEPRRFGKPAYSMVKLLHLALSTFTSHSLLPLKFAGLVGFSIVAFSGPLGLFIFVDKYILSDPLGFNFSGIAILAVLNLFLVGLVLLSLGFVAIYIGNIYGEVINRPLFVVNRRKLE
jgi:dolichol-phosphate mannosyltransferase